MENPNPLKNKTQEQEPGSYDESQRRQFHITSLWKFHIDAGSEYREDLDAYKDGKLNMYLI